MDSSPECKSTDIRCPCTPVGIGAVLALDPGTSLGWALRTTDGQITHGTLDLRSRRFEGAATLRAVFRCEDGDYRGARCVLPTGEAVEVHGRRTPFFSLCRKLEMCGYGDCRIEISTPTGTPSLRGLVKVMAGLRIEESDKDGLRLRAYRPFPPGRVAKERDLKAA